MKDNIKMHFGEISCVHERWMKQYQDCVQWQVLVSMMLNLWILQPLLVNL
jgi:hypothetical protein